MITFGHSAGLRQGQPAIAIDLDLDLLDELPDSGVAGDFRDGGVKQFVGLVEGFAVAGGSGLALPLQHRAQRQDLARCRALGGQPRGGFLERLADDDGLGEGVDRNP